MRWMWNCRGRFAAQQRLHVGDAVACFQSSGCVEDGVSSQAVCRATLSGVPQCSGLVRRLARTWSRIMVTLRRRVRQIVKRGRRLEYFTIGYNSLEGVTSIVAGLIAGSVLLVRFGLDSLDRSDIRSRAGVGTPPRPERYAARASRTRGVANRRSVFHCAGDVHPLRIQFHAGPTRSSGAKHCRHPNREHLGDRHAATGLSETASCCPDWQQSDARRFKTGRLL
jgi:hypothetical protein